MGTLKRCFFAALAAEQVARDLIMEDLKQKVGLKLKPHTQLSVNA